MAVDEQTHQDWQALHRRAVSGEALSAEEQDAYEAGCREKDAEERLDGGLERLRELRAQIAVAERKRLARRERYTAHLEEQLTTPPEREAPSKRGLPPVR